ncbi:PAS domain protein [Treponema primitia ZAS-2]|uniref:histidine kinase n=1 Tax=Treponema primitia (strain ATCC BAA-887 / DSM 12427 / ZAS-2) TaxID=545694 RepID=F5YJZ3_TREPZ|nr:ATP-binding protein [Treponema primitia]AEF84793.1 PAS domain protein [Treponema primitia ZAS-2]
MVDDEDTPLGAELKKVQLEVKKLTRELNLANTVIARNKIAAEAKDNLSKIISEKKSALEKYMNLLLENCPDIILLFDQEGKIVYCTEAFLKCSHIPAFGIINGSSYRDILADVSSPALLDRIDAIYGSSVAGDPIITNEVIDFSRDGNPRDYSIQITPMLVEGGISMGAMVLFYDTTEILVAQREAENANKAKSDFLATVSHEIRTPMNAIIGISNILKSTDLTGEQQNYLKSIQNSSQVLLTLINDILDFSKIEAGKLELIPDFFSLTGLLSRLNTMFEMMFTEKRLGFSCDFSETLPGVVFGDEKRIGQVLTNILNNALKYTNSGWVKFRAAPDGDGIFAFAVEDTGIGIREEAIPRLFTAFEQLDQVRNKNVVGTGLGLAITKRLCTMMNGSIDIKSVYGEGSVFTIRLPLKPGTAADLPQQNVPLINFTAPDARVLLVDDIEINLEVAEYLLGTFGIKPDTAKSGREAVALAGEKRYDLILMDHMMPEMDGIEATRIIRITEGPNALVSIIALTANAVSGAKEMFLANGFSGFLSKPMDSLSLTEGLLRWLPENLICKQE